MSKAVDMTNRRIGRLTVLERAPRPVFYTGTDAWWLCRCDCGTVKAISARQLRVGHTHSCGCYRRERAIEINRKRGEKHD